MPLTFYALDNEFAASTGSNVGVGDGISYFDNPPNGSHNLVITANEGDTDPRLFELGDTYDISFGGIGGSTLEDAVVVRSDAAPGDGGIIVFSGTNESGDAVEIVWTPDFDLEGWYWDNFTPSAEPGFYTTDTNSSYTHEFVCFAAATRIKVPGGTVAACDLRAGDRVNTLDQGAMAVRWSGQHNASGTGSAAPVLFEAGSIGNHSPLRLSQQHRVMLRSPLAELLFGASEVFVPAKAMVNGADIRLSPCHAVSYVHLSLDSHQVLFAEGAPCESLLLGDMALDLVSVQHCTSGELDNGRQPATSARPVLTYRQARLLLSCPGGRGDPVGPKARSGIIERV